MYGHVEPHVRYMIENATVRRWPFPHIYVENVFPNDFYWAMVDSFPIELLRPLVELGRVSKNYSPARSLMVLSPDEIAKLPEPTRPVWTAVADALLNTQILNALTGKFSQEVAGRFGGQDLRVAGEVLVVADNPTFSLGPHTDSATKLVSSVFYIPPMGGLGNYGTAIYIPNEAGKTCPGGRHHPFEDFKKVYQMPYQPNALFAFPKTDKAFHGVEAVPDGVVRHLLIQDWKVLNG